MQLLSTTTVVAWKTLRQKRWPDNLSKSKAVDTRQVRTHKTFTCWTWNTETSPVQWASFFYRCLKLKKGVTKHEESLWFDWLHLWFCSDDGKLTAGAPAQAALWRNLWGYKVRFWSRKLYSLPLMLTIQKTTSIQSRFPTPQYHGTSGRDLFGPLNDFYQQHKDDSHVFWMDKGHYSSFSGTDLDIRLRERGINTVILTGVLTDICVLNTAVDAYNPIKHYGASSCVADAREPSVCAALKYAWCIGWCKLTRLRTRNDARTMSS